MNSAASVSPMSRMLRIPTSALSLSTLVAFKHPVDARAASLRATSTCPTCVWKPCTAYADAPYKATGSQKLFRNASTVDDSAPHDVPLRARMKPAFDLTSAGVPAVLFEAQPLVEMDPKELVV